MYESAEEKKKREGKGENIWKRKGSFLRRRRQTEKEEKENNRKKNIFRRRKLKRRKILGEGKYIFLWRKRTKGKIVVHGWMGYSLLALEQNVG